MSRHARSVCGLFAAATVGVTTACATVTKPYTNVNQVSVMSDPPAAAVTADGESVGETPVTVQLEHQRWWGQGRGGVMLRLEKDGFAPSEVWIERRVNRWVLVNLMPAAIAGVLAAADRSTFERWSPGRVAAATLLWSVGIDFLSGSFFAFPRSVDTKLSRAASVRRWSRMAPSGRPGAPRSEFVRTEAPEFTGALIPQRRDTSMPHAATFVESDLPSLDLQLSDLKIDDLQVADVREAVALPETGASSGSSGGGHSCSCCGSSSCCAAC